MINRNNQRGLALLLALTVVAIATVIATELFSLQKRMLSHTEATRNLEMAWQYALAGELSAAAVLKQDFENDVESDIKRDTLNEAWAASGDDVKPVEIPGGNIKVTIIDLNRYYNINNYFFAVNISRRVTGQGDKNPYGYTPSSTPQPSTPQPSTPQPSTPQPSTPQPSTPQPTSTPQLTPEEFETSLSDYYFLTDLVLGTLTDEAIRDKIIDFQDPDHTLFYNSGAELEQYKSEDLGYSPANQPLQDKRELALIEGIDPANLPAVIEKITALPTFTRININTADTALLRLLDNDMDEINLSLFTEGIREETDIQNFFQQMGINDDSDKHSLIANLLTTRSEYFLAETEVNIASIKLTLYSTLYRDKDGKISVIKRTRIKP